MIVESKKRTAFDVIEAVMQLSDIYEKHGSNRTCSIDFFSYTSGFSVWFGERKGNKIACSKFYFEVYLDDSDFGNTFEEVFAKIVEEMEEMEDGTS